MLLRPAAPVGQPAVPTPAVGLRRSATPAPEPPTAARSALALLGGLVASRGSRLRRQAEKKDLIVSEAEASEEAEEAEEEERLWDAFKSTSDGAITTSLYQPVEESPKRKIRARRMPFDPKAEPGAMEPFGYFDPLGICPPGDEGKFKQLRAAELKHGRVAMLASVGLLAQCYIRLPILGLKDSPAGYKAALLVPSLWMFGLVVITSMLFEWLWWNLERSYAVGTSAFGCGKKSLYHILSFHPPYVQDFSSMTRSMTL
eukprot:Skav205543  [mRNA]  locus=scaffold1012:135297:138391:- [translate_table: standard]